MDKAPKPVLVVIFIVNLIIAAKYIGPTVVVRIEVNFKKSIVIHGYISSTVQSSNIRNNFVDKYVM